MALMLNAEIVYPEATQAALHKAFRAVGYPIKTLNDVLIHDRLLIQLIDQDLIHNCYNKVTPAQQKLQ